MINIVGSVASSELQRTTTLTREQISKACNSAIEAIKNELPEEARSIEAFDFILGQSKELLHSVPLELQ